MWTRSARSRPVRTGRAALLKDVVWAEGPLGRGHSTSTGAVHAFGDRTAVPGRVTCPRLEWLAPGRAECPLPGTRWGLVATTHPGCDAGRGVCPGCSAGRILCQAMVAGLSGDRLEGDTEDRGPAALALAHAQAAAQGLHTAPRPLHVRPDEPRYRRGRRSSMPLRG